MTVLVQCTIQASRHLRWALTMLHGLAVVSLLLAELGWSARLAGLGLLALSAAWSLRRSAPISLRCLADGSLLLADDQDWLEAELLAGSLAQPACCVLRLRVNDRVRTVVTLPDSLAEDDFRRLRVWLRWQAVWPRAPRWPAPRP